MIRKLLYSILVLMILTVTSAIFNVMTSQGSSDGELPPNIDPFAEAVEPPPEPPEYVEGVVDAHLAYAFDVLAIDTYFVKVRAFPGAGVPSIVGGFTTTDVEVVVKVRGVSCPSACRTAASRTRPHQQVDRERERWSKGMQYVTSLLMMKQSLRLENLAIVDEQLVADVYYYLGGGWHNLADTLISDGFARTDTLHWNWGASQLSPQQ